MRIFRPSVEAWRSLVSQYNGGMPTDFLLAWLDVESGGNACSTTSLDERGIFQIHPEEAKYTNTDFGLLRPACSGGKLTRSLTDDEKKIQVISGVYLAQHYRERARSILNGVGADWSEASSDFWKLVKLGHALPAVGSEGLPWVKRTLGRAPTGWDEFVSTFDRMPCSAMSSALAKFCNSASHDGLKNRISDTIANADKVGSAGGSTGILDSLKGPGIPGWLAVTSGILLAGAAWYGAKRFTGRHTHAA